MKALSKLGGEAGYVNIILGFFHIYLWVSGAKRDLRGHWMQQGCSKHLNKEYLVP